MSLKSLAAETLARISQSEAIETAHETSMKQMKQAVSCFMSTPSCFIPMKHGEAQKTAKNDACFIVSSPRDGNSETSATQARALVSWRRGLTKLDPWQSRAGLSDARWNELVRDTISLFNGWALQAVQLGWGELDLFGINPDVLADDAADPDAPHGLAWRLRGRRIQRMFDGGASYALMMGKPGKFYRGDPAGRVLLWRMA